MDYKTISVLITVYRSELFLEKCINSVLSQTYSNWELVLVDNGSPDKCPEICDKYAERDKRIKVVHLKENVKVAGGRNACLDAASGEYITFLDSDDLLHPDFLMELVTLCEENHADIAQCGYVRGSDYIFPDDEQLRAPAVFDNHSVFIKEASTIVIWGKVYKRHLFDGVRFPEGVFYEDDRTTWKLYFAAQKVVITDRRLYYYYDNINSTMVGLTKAPSLNYVEAYDERISYFESLGYQDMVQLSNLQLAKSLVLTYSNPMLTTDQKKYVVKRSKNSIRSVLNSPCVKVKYKVLFAGFGVCPLMISKIANFLR